MIGWYADILGLITWSLYIFLDYTRFYIPFYLPDIHSIKHVLSLSMALINTIYYPKMPSKGINLEITGAEQIEPTLCAMSI